MAFSVAEPLWDPLYPASSLILPKHTFHVLVQSSSLAPRCPFLRMALGPIYFAPCCLSFSLSPLLALPTMLWPHGPSSTYPELGVCCLLVWKSSLTYSPPLFCLKPQNPPLSSHNPLFVPQSLSVTLNDNCLPTNL